MDPRGLIDFYRLIDCDLIDITCREINRKRYDIICDDCGWFRDDVKFSAVIITGEADADGEQTDLQPQDIKYLLDNIHKVRTRRYPKGYWMLCNVND